MARHRISTAILRETGLAIAMFAVWMLALLAPLHQTAGLLHAMARAGHVLPAGWSICVTLAQDEDGPQAPVPVCPAQALAKSGVALPPLPVAVPGPALRAPERLAVLHPALTPPQAPRLPGQPRAPPVRA